MMLAHGIFRIEVINNIIYVQLEGAFNESGVLDWTTATKKIITDFKGEKFCILMDLSKALGSTPDGFKQADQYNSWLNDQNLVAKALIFPSLATEYIEQTMVKSKRKQNIKSFDNVVDAENWLKTLLK